MHHIFNWNDIGSDFTDGVLLGNGASISVDQCFSYRSLKEHAVDRGLLAGDVSSLFEYFATDDFELVLRLLWQSSKVNEALDVVDYKTKCSYEHVRETLIKSVQDVHAARDEVITQFCKIADFLSRFKTVLTLNYDLVLYWVMMYAKNIDCDHAFKDCFVGGEFNSDWQRFRQGIWGKNRVSLVFYLHGSLALARDVCEREVKLETMWGHDLLSSIVSFWRSGDYIPLFVSEGTAAQKKHAIQRSHYLNTVYSEVIPKVGTSLVVYGWGFGEHDKHILDRLRYSGVKNLAVSVYGNDQAYCNKVFQMVRDNLGFDVGVCFFDSTSHGCWNN